jgi:fumarylacetoacetate (FAA) hydrolase family protein
MRTRNDDACCASCPYFAVFDDENEIDPVDSEWIDSNWIGECRRFPPAFQNSYQPRSNAKRGPVVEGYQLCGEHPDFWKEEVRAV